MKGTGYDMEIKNVCGGHLVLQFIKKDIFIKLLDIIIVCGGGIMKVAVYLDYFQ